MDFAYCEFCHREFLKVYMVELNGFLFWLLDILNILNTLESLSHCVFFF